MLGPGWRGLDTSWEALGLVLILPLCHCRTEAGALPSVDLGVILNAL